MKMIVGMVLLALGAAQAQAQTLEEPASKTTICELMGRIAYDLAMARLEGRPDPHKATADEGALSYARPLYDYARARFYDRQNGSPTGAFHFTYARCIDQIDELVREHRSRQ